jgi:hypothetical protein
MGRELLIFHEKVRISIKLNSSIDRNIFQNIKVNGRKILRRNFCSK